MSLTKVVSLTAHGPAATGNGGNRRGRETPYTAGSFLEILCEGGREDEEEGKRKGGRGKGERGLHSTTR